MKSCAVVTVWHAIDLASSAAVRAAVRSARSLTIAQDCTSPAAGSAGAGTSKIDPNLGFAPPSVAWLVSAVTKARGTAASRTPAREATPSVRTTSTRRGWSTTATSGPPAKKTWPLHHAASSETRYAASGPRFSGPGMESSDSPPPPPARPSARARSSAAATMRVLAIGESALIVTPGGATRPSCQVSAATTRLAALYPPASAARHPEPEVTPRMRPWPASAMRGRAASRTLR